MLSLGFVRRDTIRNRARVPSFRRIRVVMPSASAPVSTTAPTPPLVSLVGEDDEVSPHDVNPRPHRRKAMDIRG